MKSIVFLIAIAFPAWALAQAAPQPALADQPQSTLPDNPATLPASTFSIWDRLEQLPRGRKIKIHFARGWWERCEFGGATDAYLYCAPGDDSDRAQTWQIDRAAIRAFKVDHDVRNGRLIFTASAVAMGLWWGIRTSHSSDDEGNAIGMGLAGAGMGALLVGWPLSCLAGHCVSIPVPPPNGFNYTIPLGRTARRFR